MNYKYYQEKIKDIVSKAPIEIGVEILVYMLLDEIVVNKELSLVAIDSMHKKNRYLSEGGFSDLAIVSKNFSFDNINLGKCVGVVETKYVTEDLSNHMPQIIGQLISFRNVIATNGIVWKFYDIDKFLDEKCENEIEAAAHSEEIASISDLLKQYSELTNKRTEIRIILKSADTVELDDSCINVDKLNKKIGEINKSIQFLDMRLSNIQSIMPIWEVNLCTDEMYAIDPQKYAKLIAYLYADWL